MEQILQSNNDNVGVIEEEMGNLQSNIDLLQTQIQALNLQINALQYERDNLKKRDNAQTVFTEITVPVVCGLAAASTYFVTDANIKKTLLIIDGATLGTFEITFNLCRFVFKVF